MSEAQCIDGLSSETACWDLPRAERRLITLRCAGIDRGPKVEKSLNAADDLRSALVPWVAVSFAVALGGYVANQFLPAGWWTAVISSLSSAAVSVGVALVITEIVLKPLYVRDVLQVARLSAQVHDSGLQSIQRLTKLDLTEVLGHGGEIDILGDPEVVRQVWHAVLDLAATTKTQVRLHLPLATEASTWRHHEMSWKQKGCSRRGSTLVITADVQNAPALALMTGSRCVIGVNDGSGGSGNPLILVFTRARSVPYVSSVEMLLEGLRDLKSVPLFESVKEVSDGESD